MNRALPMENEEHVFHRELDGAQNAPPTRLTGIILAGKGPDLKRLFHCIESRVSSPFGITRRYALNAVSYQSMVSDVTFFRYRRSFRNCWRDETGGRSKKHDHTQTGGPSPLLTLCRVDVVLRK